MSSRRTLEKFGLGILLIFLIFGLLVTVLLQRCSVSPSRSFSLKENDIIRLKKEVEGGAGASAIQLAKYYSFSENDTRQMYFWYEKAALLSDPTGKRAIKGFLDTYGMQKYREILNRTNEQVECDLLRILYDSNETEKSRP